MSETIDLKHTSVDQLAKLVAHVYEGVSLSDDPTFRWLNVFTDVTILGEEIRRGESRRSDAVERAMKVLIRLLDFVGFYLTRKVKKGDYSFSNFFGEIVQTSSYTKVFPDPNDPPEGPSRWILVKYPHTCAKCAEAPCECVLTPWLFEERRQKPSGYEAFRKKAETARKDLSSESLLTLPSLFSFFSGIYRNTYYSQDIWKTTMHLSEEVGEVTAQLVRVQLLHRVHSSPSLLGKSKTAWAPIKQEADGRLNRILNRVDDNDEMKPILQQEKTRTLADAIEVARKSTNPAKYVALLAGEKLKEEIADVFSWLSAVIIQLSKGQALNAKYLQDLLENEEYLHSVHDGQLELKCKWCGKRQCTDRCLINHGIAAELYENAAKF